MMTKSKLQSEIDMLRAQVAELTAARESEKNDTEEKAAAREKEAAASDAGSGKDGEMVIDKQKKSSKAPAGQASSEDKSAEEKNSGNDIEHQFQELIETIDTELKEASPATVLVVFAAGILLGRLLPR
jgi:hypothetical protein